MIDDLYLHCIRKPLSPFRKETYEWLEKEKSVLNAESIFSALVHRKTDEAFAGRLKQNLKWMSIVSGGAKSPKSETESKRGLG